MAGPEIDKRRKIFSSATAARNADGSVCAGGTEVRKACGSGIGPGSLPTGPADGCPQ
jgi:hypothetical protein